MAYVSRNGEGNIDGVFNRPQPGIAEEYLPDDDPEIVAYRGNDLTGLKKSACVGIKTAMFSRINQGIRWAWSSEETIYVINLDSGMREIIDSWHSLLHRPVPSENPHNGFIKSNGIIIKGPGGIDIPDNAIDEIAEFSGLIVSKFSQIAIAYDALVLGMNDAEFAVWVNGGGATSIDWTIRDEVIGDMTITDWPAEKTDWDNDLVLYNP